MSVIVSVSYSYVVVCDRCGSNLYLLPRRKSMTETELIEEMYPWRELYGKDICLSCLKKREQGPTTSVAEESDL